MSDEKPAAPGVVSNLLKHAGFVSVFVLLLIFGPANMFAYFKNASLYTILIGVVIAFFVIKMTVR